MSFKSTLRLDAKIFSPSARRVALGGVVVRAAKEFKNDLRRKMIEGPHTGEIYERGKASGAGFTRRHRASRRGERPAPESRNLVNSIEDRKLSEISAKVEVTKPYLDKDGEEVLQGKLGRKIMTSEDVREADKNFNDQAQRALIGLL